MNLSPRDCLQALCNDCEPVRNDCGPECARIRNDREPKMRLFASPRHPVCKPLHLLFEGDKDIFSWLRWSHSGDTIAFLNYDISQQEPSTIWTVSKDGSNRETLSTAAWGYPPVWSPDDTKIVFADAGHIWEYDLPTKSLNRVTNFDSMNAEHPAYSADGQTIVFSATESGHKQIWASRSGDVEQITDGEKAKDYPIIP